MTFSSEVLADNPWLYYTFDESDPQTTDPQDASGNGRHATYLRSMESYAFKNAPYGGVTDDNDRCVLLGDVVEKDYGPQYGVRYSYNVGQFSTPAVPASSSYAIEIVGGHAPKSVLGTGLGPGMPYGSLSVFCPGFFYLNFSQSYAQVNGLAYNSSFTGGYKDEWNGLGDGLGGPYAGWGSFALSSFSGLTPTSGLWPSRFHMLLNVTVSGDRTQITTSGMINGTTFGPTTHPQWATAFLAMSPVQSRSIRVGGQRVYLDALAYYDHTVDPARAVSRHNNNFLGIISGKWTNPVEVYFPPDPETFTTTLSQTPTSLPQITATGTQITGLPTLNDGATGARAINAITGGGEMNNPPQPDGELRRILPVASQMIMGLDTAVALDPITISPSVSLTLPVEFETETVIEPRVIRPAAKVTIRFLDPSPAETTYRLLVTDVGGNRLAELENASLGAVPWKVVGITGFQFTLPADDPKVVWCKEARYEVQVWRNDRFLWGGPIVRVNNNGKTVEVQCMDPNWYFTRRVIGRVPKKNLLLSEDGFPANRAGWSPAYLPRSEPTTGPAITTSMENTYSDRPSLRLSSSTGRTKATYSNDDWYNGTRLRPAAKADLRALLDELTEFTNRPRVMVKVFDDNAGTRTASDAQADARAEAVSDFILDNYPQAKVVVESPAYRDPLNNNSTAGERTANRRTVLIYQSVDGIKGHKQHATQTVTLRNPGKKERKQAVSFTGYVFIEDEAGWAAGMKGVELVRSDPRKKHPDPKWAAQGYKKPLQTGTVLFGDGFATGAWVRVVATVVLPNDGKKSQIEVRLFPPNGDAMFSEMWLVRDESLTFKRQEQADIVTALVEHAQSTAHGKADLNIGTHVPKTGVKRTRSYPYDERASIYELLEEFPTLANGVEWQIVQTPDTRTFTTYYPRMGRDTEVVLAYGSNAVSYGVGSDGTLLATTVVIQAPTGDDYTREERSAQDPTLMDGLVLEQVYTGTPNSPAASWQKQAERGLARYRRPITMPELTMHPDFTDELLSTVQIGDRVITNITDAVTNVDDVQKCRVTEITLNPATDTLTYALYPEDLNVVTLSPFGAVVRYFSQPQNPIVGSTGKVAVESNPEFADRGFADGAWSVGPAGVGWVKVATGPVMVNPGYQPSSVVTDTHEVWIRKWVKCTGDMVLTLRAADWAFLYVNGHLVGNDYFEGYNRVTKIGTVNLRIPSAWLDSSGDQLIAVHSQFDPARRSSTEMDSVYADVAVRGTYDPGAVI